MILHLVTGIEDVRLGGRKPRSLGKTLRENGSGKKQVLKSNSVHIRRKV